MRKIKNKNNTVFNSQAKLKLDCERKKEYFAIKIQKVEDNTKLEIINVSAKGIQAGINTNKDRVGNIITDSAQVLDKQRNYF